MLFILSIQYYHTFVEWSVIILKPHHKHVVGYSTRDLFQFVDKIESIITEIRKMMSLNVMSLVTNVTLREIVEYAREERVEYKL